LNWLRSVNQPVPAVFQDLVRQAVDDYVYGIEYKVTGRVFISERFRAVRQNLKYKQCHASAQRATRILVLGQHYEVRAKQSTAHQGAQSDGK
jgi:hypothetical protein